MTVGSPRCCVKATKDLNFLINDDWDVRVDDLMDAYMTRAYIFQSQQRSLKAKADFKQVRVPNEPRVSARVCGAGSVAGVLSTCTNK